MRRTAFCSWLLGSYIIALCSLVVPLLLFAYSPFFTGILPIRSSDEGHYIVRMHAHILRPFVGTPDGVWTIPSSPKWLQVSSIEYLGGSLLSWIGLNSLQASWLLMVLCAPLAVPLMSLLLRRCGVAPMSSLILGLVFFFLMHGLSRMFHPSISLPMTLMAYLALWNWWEKPTATMALFAGSMAGLLVSVYFWSWTFVWTVWLCLLPCIFLSVTHRRARLFSLAFVGLACIIIASPAFLQSYQLSTIPIFDEVSQRMGLLMSRELESPMRSLLLLSLVCVYCFCFWGRGLSTRYAPLTAAVFAICIVYHQQLLTARIMSFSTHYYPYVCVVAMLVLGLTITLPSLCWRAWLVGSLACIPLLAAAHDYGLLSKHPFFSLAPDDVTHMGQAVDALNAQVPGIVLTDGYTGNLVGATTTSAPVFIEYARILMITTEEYVERYCLSEALKRGSIDTQWVADFQEEKSRAARDHTRALYEKHLQMGVKICLRVRENITAYMRHFHVRYVLWNEYRKPDWYLDPTSFVLLKQGEGWSLWRVRE